MRRLVAMLIAAASLGSASAAQEDAPSAPVAPEPVAQATSTSSSSTSANLVEALAALPDAASFRIALEASGLVETLAATGPFTLLVPSDEAMGRFDTQTLRSLLEPDMQPALVAIVAHHVIPGRRSAAELATTQSVPALSGRKLDIRATARGPVIAGAVVQRADVQASNGVIHVIDTVLLPTTRSLKVALDSTGRFTTFLELCERAGVDELLEGGDELTIFAPTDEAFEQVPAKTLRQLRSERNRAELRRLLERHIVAGRISALEATAGAPPRTLAGSDVRCAIRGSSAPRPFGAVEIIAPDLDAVNGCVHVISEVLTPPSGFTLAPTGRLILGVFLDSAGPVLASQFALDGKRALVVQRLTPGGPAQQVGVQPNDVIVAINGETATSSVLDRAKHAAGYGGSVALTIYRKGEKLIVNVPVGAEDE